MDRPALFSNKVDAACAQAAHPALANPVSGALISERKKAPCQSRLMQEECSHQEKTQEVRWDSRTKKLIHALPYLKDALMEDLGHFYPMALKSLIQIGR
ncbi:MAG TPA: hypothetical protein DD706_05585 [Nitrospiraceae bacterium]|nr:hypothetical protein [Nitrospiraceae bacterium]